MEYGGWGNGRNKNYESQSDLQSISEEIVYLICPYNPTFYEHNDVQGTKVYKSPKFFNKSHLFGKEGNIGHSCDHYWKIIRIQSCPKIYGITV